MKHLRGANAIVTGASRGIGPYGRPPYGPQAA